MSERPNPPSGFYKDPNGLPVERWWDGDQWADLTRPLPRAEPEEPGAVGPLLPRWDWKRIANFSSRTRRVEFWAAVGVGFSIALLVGVVINSSSEPGVALLGLVSLAAWIWLFWGSAVNRFHDMGQSGLLILLFLIPLVNLGMLFWIGTGPGERQHNRRGPPVA